MPTSSAAVTRMRPARAWHRPQIGTAIVGKVASLSAWPLSPLRQGRKERGSRREIRHCRIFSVRKHHPGVNPGHDVAPPYTQHLLLGSKSRPNVAALDLPMALEELHGRNLTSALMRRTRDRGGKPIRLADRGHCSRPCGRIRGALSHDAR
jgi:hypothetical protein